MKDAKRWEAIWAEHRGKSTAPCPEVDFTREMVIVATLGPQRTGGYSIRIAKVEATRDKLRICLERRTPRPNSRVIQVLTAPYEFVAVPRSDLTSEFVEENNSARK